MFKHLFGNRDNSDPTPLLSKSQLERMLSEMRNEILPVSWMILVKSKSGLMASSPVNLSREAVPLDAMISAISSLGERVVNEMKNGVYQYTVVASGGEMVAAIQLSPKYVLGLGIKRSASLEATLQQVMEKSVSIQKALGLPGSLRLSGIQQG